MSALERTACAWRWALVWVLVSTASCIEEGHPTLARRDAGADDAAESGVLSIGDATTTLDDASTCAIEVQEAERVPLDLYVMLDRSGSMNEVTATGASKWSAVGTALDEFLRDPESAGIGIGLQYFPLLWLGAPARCTSHAECGRYGPCALWTCTDREPVTPCLTDSDCGGMAGVCQPFGICDTLVRGQIQYCHPLGSACDPAGRCVDFAERWCDKATNCGPRSYEAPAVSITALPGGADAILDSIAVTAPEGRTPSGPALQGAEDHARAWAKSHPDHAVAVILATDGLPTECAPREIDAIADIAAGAAGESIRTFVVGVFAAEDTDGPRNLDVIARAGDTEQALIVDAQGDVASELVRVLGKIRGSAPSCELRIPRASKGPLDFDRVNLSFSSSGEDEELVYVRSDSRCEPDGGPDGWYYDADPSEGATPTTIVLCPGVCARMKAAPRSRISVQIGCETVVR